MLDFEIVVPAAGAPTDIVSVAEMRRHLRIPATISTYDLELSDYVTAALGMIEGPGAELNRSIRPVTYTRYLSRFPDLKDDRGKVIKTLGGPIMLPFPPLIDVIDVSVAEDSPSEIDETIYVVKTGGQVAEVWPTSTWPDVDEGQRAISITFRAGFPDFSVTTGLVPAVKQYVKMLAGHYFETREITVNEARVLAINRKVEYGGDYLRAMLKVANSQDDWGE